jgi:integrase
MFKLPPNTERKADGIYRYRRRVPVKAIKALGKGFLYRNLGRTKDEVLGNWAAAREEVEALFEQAKSDTDKEAKVFAEASERDKVLHLVEKHYGKEASEMLSAGVVDENLEHALMGLPDDLHGSIPRKTEAILYSGRVPDIIVSLSKVIDAYYEYKTTGKVATDKRLHNRLMRNKADLIASLGDVKISKLPIENITRKDANTYRDFLLKRVSPSSVARNKNTVNAVINWHIKENGLDTSSPFNGLIIKGSTHTKNDKLPLTQQDVSQLNSQMSASTAEPIYILLRDTGMRVGEVAGLLVGDVSLQDKTLHIKPNDIRTLKTLGSERVIPLSEASLVALQEYRHGKDDNDPIFPQYAKPNGNTNLSATLMKQFRKVITDPLKSAHSLRHSISDNLRNTGCDSSLKDAILGHTTAGMGARYGSGYSPQVMREALVKVW